MNSAGRRRSLVRRRLGRLFGDWRRRRLAGRRQERRPGSER